MGYEDMEVEVTAELLDFVGNQMNLECKREDLHGREYLKVYGDIYHDLGIFKYKWLNHRPNAPILDFCNMCSGRGIENNYWYMSVITNFNKLGPDLQRRIMANN